MNCIHSIRTRVHGRSESGEPVRRRCSRRWALRALAHLSAFLIAVGSGLAADASKELQVKCSYLHNLAKFVEWPPETFLSEGSPLIIGVYGSDLIRQELEAQVKGRRVGKRPFQVRRIETCEDVAGVHVLYLSEAPDPIGCQLIAAAATGARLTVGDTDQFGRSGGIIRFILEEDKVRFEINQAMAERARLKLSPQLLKLARVVKRTEPMFPCH